MSEEILTKESEEMTEEELSEKKKVAAEQDSSDEKEEEVEEAKTSKASVKKELISLRINESDGIITSGLFIKLLILVIPISLAIW